MTSREVVLAHQEDTPSTRIVEDGRGRLLSKRQKTLQ